MTALGVFIGLGAFISYKLISYKIKRGKSKGNKIIFLVGGGLVGLLFWFIYIGIFQQVLPHKVSILEQEKLEIVVSNDLNGMRGFLFFVPGDLDEKSYYRFYVRPFDEEKEIRKVSLGQIIIYEEDRLNAYLAKGYEVKEYPRWTYRWVAPKFFTKLQGRELRSIHVPIGTFKIGHEMDKPQK